MSTVSVADSSVVHSACLTGIHAVSQLTALHTNPTISCYLPVEAVTATDQLDIAAISSVPLQQAASHLTTLQAATEHQLVSCLPLQALSSDALMHRVLTGDGPVEAAVLRMSSVGPSLILTPAQHQSLLRTTVPLQPPLNGGVYTQHPFMNHLYSNNDSDVPLVKISSSNNDDGVPLNVCNSDQLYAGNELNVGEQSLLSVETNDHLKSVNTDRLCGRCQLTLNPAAPSVSLLPCCDVNSLLSTAAAFHRPLIGCQCVAGQRLIGRDSPMTGVVCLQTPPLRPLIGCECVPTQRLIGRDSPMTGVVCVQTPPLASH